MALGAPSDAEIAAGAIGAILGFAFAVVVGSLISAPTSGSAGTNVTEYHPEGYHPDSNVVENQGYFF